MSLYVNLYQVTGVFTLYNPYNKFLSLAGDSMWDMTSTLKGTWIFRSMSKCSSTIQDPDPLAVQACPFKSILYILTNITWGFTICPSTLF